MREGWAGGERTRRFIEDAVAAENPEDAHLPFRKGTRLIGKQNVHAPRRLDTDHFSDENTVFQHTLHVGREDDGDHHWQPLRHCHDNDGDDQRHDVHERREDESAVHKAREDLGAVKAGGEEKGIEQIGDGDERRHDIADAADLPRKVGETEFQGAFPRVLLQLGGKRTVERFAPDTRDTHACRPGRNKAPAEHRPGRG